MANCAVVDNTLILMKGIIVNNTPEPLTGLLKDCRSVYVVYDTNVREFTELEVIPLIPKEIFRGSLSLVLGETNKTLETVGDICRWLLDGGADRTSTVLAVGGGITTDTVGFAASVYERGIRCAYIPTTLLAQVDAAVGGKTGVNLDSYKNMVGTFTMPLFTLITSSPLARLPRREFLCGAAEVIKSFIIEDGGWYGRSVDFLERYGRGEADASDPEVTAIVEAAVSVKAGIVERDFREGGERKKLNLGHTFAHAIEHISQRKASCGEISAPVPHGEAVAMGIVLAAELSEKLGVAGEGLAAGIRRDLARAGLPVESPYPVSELKEAMFHDKKARGNSVDFVLIRRIGDTVVMKLEIDSI